MTVLGLTTCSRCGDICTPSEVNQWGLCHDCVDDIEYSLRPHRPRRYPDPDQLTLF